MGPTRATSDEKEGHYHYNNNNNNRNKIMEKKKEVKEAAAAAVVTMKFGDEQSDLLDQYERRSFEVHLNLAMQLGRSLSSPGAMFLAPTSPFLVPNTPPTPPPPQLLSQVRQGRRRRQTGLKKVLWKLLLGVPMIIVRSRGKKKEVPDHKDPKFWKSFSRSLKI